MGFLSREDILKADDREIREVDVPEWGGTVRVRAMSGYDRDAYRASMLQIQKDGQASPELGNMTAKLVARSIIDEDGNLMFNELDVGRLGQLSSAALDRVSNVAAEISGLTDTAVEDAKENLEPTRSGGSGSGSPDS